MPKRYLYRIEILSDDNSKVLHYFQEHKLEDIVKKLYELKGIKTTIRSLQYLKEGKIPATRSKLKNILIKQEEIATEKPCTNLPKFKEHPTFIKLRIDTKVKN